MSKRPQYIALGLIMVLTLSISTLPTGSKARLKAGLGNIFLPLFGLEGSAHELAEDAGSALKSRGALLKDNAALKAENQELKLRLGRTAELERENARLRQLLGWQQQTRLKAKLARVVAREPANWWHTLQIDLGARDGVRENMPVLSEDGFLAGRISVVSWTRSQVVLLGDPNCKVPAVVQNDTRDQGIIGVSGPLDSAFVELGYLSANCTVKPGQNVMTSGYSTLFPKDILIGKIVDSRQVEDGLSIVARVKLSANLNALEEVWVVLSL